MRRIEPDLDLSFLLEIGEVIQISYSLYQVILRFFSEAWISIESECRIVVPGDGVFCWKPEEEISDMKGFTQLLQSRIQSYRVANDCCLTLSFENHCVLQLEVQSSGL